MYPAIKDGDMVKVKVCTDGNLINVGDIITYSVIVTNNPHPDYMWIGHRVTQKYQNGQTWYFKTKGDNNPQPDPWTIPDYFLLGIIVEINPTKFPSDAEPTAAPRISSSEKAPVETALPSIIEKIATITLAGISVLIFLRTIEEELKRHNAQRRYHSGVENF